jgi:antitoxin component YwqK of YwqJK toxin-antitoxin module
VNGKATGYFQNGNISSISKYNMGQKVGTWFFYYENGSMAAEYNYDYSSNKSSKSITYYPNGNIETKEEFTKDFSLLYYYSFSEKKDTTYKCIPIDFEKQMYEFISYYDSGLIEYSGQIQMTKEGQKEMGIWKWFDEKGNLTKEVKK